MISANIPWDYAVFLDKVEAKYGKEWFTFIEVEDYGLVPMQLGAMMRSGLLEKEGYRYDHENHRRLSTKWRISQNGLRKLLAFRKRTNL